MLRREAWISWRTGTLTTPALQDFIEQARRQAAALSPPDHVDSQPQVRAGVRGIHPGTGVISDLRSRSAAVIRAARLPGHEGHRTGGTGHADLCFGSWMPGVICTFSVQ